MKNTFIISLAAAVLLIISPLLLLTEKVAPLPQKIAETISPVKSEKATTDYFRIKTKNGIKKLSAKEYLIGVLAGEVSPLYEKEALKAQTVAAYTFALRRALYAKSINREYDLTDDPATDQCYTDKETAAKKWGENAEEYRKKLETAVDEVYGMWLEYDNSPALTVYHAVSSGTTNSSADVWGNALPYLTSVSSIGDKLSKNYLSEYDFSAETFKEKLEDLCKTDTSKNAIGEIKKSDSGLVLTAAVGDKTLSGAEIQKALGLVSASFDVEYSAGNYHFTVYGRGHGVGMSQTGAEYMAKQGSSFEEILSHYYKGTKLKKS